MCLPASGPISISQIRNEIVTGGCGSSTYSLSALASLAGFPSDPDAMSEFYNYCCCNSYTAFTLSSSTLSGSAACSNYPGSTATYYSSSGASLGNGTMLFYDQCLTNPVSCGTYLSNGTNYWSISCGGPNGLLGGQTSCATTTTTTTPPTTTTTTAAPAGCHNYQATASSYISYTDCCGTFQSYYITVGTTFCAQIGTVFGYYIDLGTNCNC